MCGDVLDLADGCVIIIDEVWLGTLYLSFHGMHTKTGVDYLQGTRSKLAKHLFGIYIHI